MSISKNREKYDRCVLCLGKIDEKDAVYDSHGSPTHREGCSKQWHSK